MKNLNKIEFVVTYACTGHCKHCSEGAVLSRKAYGFDSLAANGNFTGRT